MTTMNELIEQMRQEDARTLVWSNTRDIYIALRLLFNAGYRGRDLVPPEGWPALVH